MAFYFQGRKQIREIIQSSHKGNGELKCTIWESWKDIDASQVIYCGALGKYELTQRSGISQRHSELLTNHIGGSIGMGGIVKLKGSIQEETGSEVNWEQHKQITQTFESKAPECGKRIDVFYQKIREYEISYFRQRRFGNEKWDRLIPEWTDCISMIPDMYPYDEKCNCDMPSITVNNFIKDIGIDFGNISIRAFVKKINEKFSELQLGSNTIELESYLIFDQANINVPIEIIPKQLIFLGNIKKNDSIVIQGTIRDLNDTSGEGLMEELDYQT